MPRFTSPSGHRERRPRRRSCPAVVVVSPAFGAPVGGERARVAPAGSNRGEPRPRRRIGLPEAVVAPASDPASGGERARVAPAGSNRGEPRPRRRIGLPEAVVAPASDPASGGERARVAPAGSNRGEPRPRRRIGLPEAVAAPASDPASGGERARVVPLRAVTAVSAPAGTSYRTLTRVSSQRRPIHPARRLTPIQAPPPAARHTRPTRTTPTFNATAHRQQPPHHHLQPSRPQLSCSTLSYAEGFAGEGEGRSAADLA